MLLVALERLPANLTVEGAGLLLVKRAKVGWRSEPGQLNVPFDLFHELVSFETSIQNIVFLSEREVPGLGGGQRPV